MDGCTTYKLSYWPHREPRRTPFTSQQESNNVLNVGCCFDDNTTYKLSYFGCGGERPLPAKPLPNADFFSKCPLSHDTVNRVITMEKYIPNKSLLHFPWNRKIPFHYNSFEQFLKIFQLSYLGNWSPKPEAPCIPCTKDLMARGPMQEVTTQKHDYTWKYADMERAVGYVPEDSLVLSPLPLDCK